MGLESPYDGAGGDSGDELSGGGGRPESSPCQVYDLNCELEFGIEYDSTYQNSALCKGDSSFGWCEENGVITLTMYGYTKSFNLNELDGATSSSITNFKNEFTIYENSQANALSDAGDTLLMGTAFVATLIITALTSPADLVPVAGQVKLGLEVLAIGTTGAATLKSGVSLYNNIQAKKDAQKTAFDIFINLPGELKSTP